jgi:hypothetical protein
MDDQRERRSPFEEADQCVRENGVWKRERAAGVRALCVFGGGDVTGSVLPMLEDKEWRREKGV